MKIFNLLERRLFQGNQAYLVFLARPARNIHNKIQFIPQSLTPDAPGSVVSDVQLSPSARVCVSNTTESLVFKATPKIYYFS